MKAALFTTGPYIDMSVSARTVMVPNLERDDGGEEIVTWRVPLGLGAIPHVALMDVRTWMSRKHQHVIQLFSMRQVFTD